MGIHSSYRTRMLKVSPYCFCGLADQISPGPDNYLCSEFLMQEVQKQEALRQDDEVLRDMV